MRVRRDDFQPGEILTVAARVPRRNHITAYRRMRADQKVRQDLFAGASPFAIQGEGARCGESGLPEQSLAAEHVLRKQRVYLVDGLVAHREFAVDDLVDEDAAGLAQSLELAPGPLQPIGI